MNYASIIIPFVGGLGMFIYGMQIMAQATHKRDEVSIGSADEK